MITEFFLLILITFFMIDFNSARAITGKTREKMRNKVKNKPIVPTKNTHFDIGWRIHRPALMEGNHGEEM